MIGASLQNTDYDQEPIEQALRQGEGDAYRSSPWACREVWVAERDRAAVDVIFEVILAECVADALDRIIERAGGSLYALGTWHNHLVASPPRRRR